MSIWIILAILSTIGELYFFFMQRSALEICRARDLPKSVRFLLMPGYYRIGWAFIIGKWICLIALLIYGKWWVAGLIFVASYIMSSLAPVPHAAFFEMFYRELDENAKHSKDDLKVILRSALESVDRQHHITKRFVDQ